MRLKQSLCYLLTVVAMAVCAGVKANDILIANDATTDGVLRYNSTTGAFIRSFLSTPIVSPTSMTYGPDGNLYVASASTHSITRYEGQTGQFIDTFVASQIGGLDAAYDMSFGPDGNLYVAERSKGILRYSGSTGSFLGAWGLTGTNKLTWAQGVTFGADGKMYVSDDAIVRRYDTSGNYLNDFVGSHVGGLEGARRLRFATDGTLWVPINGGISQYNGITGAWMGGIQNSTRDIVFRDDGKLLLDSSCTVSAYDFKTQTAPYLIPCNDGHLSNAVALVVMVPEPAIVLWAVLGTLALLRRR